MGERELPELEDSGSWDFDRAERRPGVKAPRAVVSVAFSRPDFETVEDAAKCSGQRTSEFIREAALARASGTANSRATTYLAFSGTPGVVSYTHPGLPETVVCGPTAEFDESKELKALSA